MNDQALVHGICLDVLRENADDINGAIVAVVEATHSSVLEAGAYILANLEWLQPMAPIVSMLAAVSETTGATHAESGHLITVAWRRELVRQQRQRAFDDERMSLQAVVGELPPGQLAELLAKHGLRRNADGEVVLADYDVL